jgi:hypothetical protein
MLFALGLFYGTEKGYELDAPVTRAQMAVMLVRLLGQEQNAVAQANAHPFTDVPAWADKFVGYLYVNKLAVGVSATKFDAAEKCTVKMYTVLALHALGYSEERADFVYNDALIFGSEKSLVNNTITAGEFTRDKMIAISYNVLLAKTKDGDILLNKLNANGSVNKENADKLLAQYVLLNEFSVVYNSAMSKIANANSFDSELYISGTGTLTNGAKDSKVEMTAARKINADDNLKMSLEATTVIDKETAYRRVYLKDGAMYFSLPAGTGQVQNVKITNGNTDAPLAVVKPSLPSDGLPNVTSEVKDGKTIYTLKINGTLAENPDILQSLDALIAFPDITVKSLAVNIFYTFDKSASLINVAKKGNIIGEIASGGKLDFNFDTTEEYAEKVVIEFPDDLDGYTDVTNRIGAETQT